MKPLVIRGLVEELNDSRDLSKLISAIESIGSQSQSVQPLVSQVSVYYY